MQEHGAGLGTDGVETFVERAVEVFEVGHRCSLLSVPFLSHRRARIR